MKDVDGCEDGEEKKRNGRKQGIYRQVYTSSLLLLIWCVNKKSRKEQRW